MSADRTPAGGPADVSADFVFGTLATDDLRLAQLRAASSRGAPRPRSRAARSTTREPCDHGHASAAASTRTTSRAYYTTDGRTRPATEAGHSRRRPSRSSGPRSPGTRCSWGYARRGPARPRPASRHARALSDRGLVRSHAPRARGRPRSPGWSPASGRPASPSRARWSRSPAAAALAGPPAAAAIAYHVDDERVPDVAARRGHLPGLRRSLRDDGGRPFAEPATPGGFYGGTLRGVIERLDHIAALGVTCIWLSPVFPSPSHHGYDATDYERSSRASAPRTTCASS